jgi:phage head maturation protease
VALCWFDANETDRRYIDQTDISFKTAEFRENRRDRAHKRFLAACKALATVRRMTVPALQINVAKRQVNQQLISPSPA